MFQKASPTQKGTNPINLYSFLMEDISSLTQCKISSFPTQPVQPIFSFILQDRISDIFSRICDLLSEVSNLQHHTKPCSIYICQNTRHQIQTDGSLHRYVLFEVCTNLNGNCCPAIRTLVSFSYSQTHTGMLISP